jgi:GH25 family lysozyme M1 (1,4-beta-N-acetylmuramidase)
MADGIDIFTAYQTVTDWHAVKNAGKSFCYIKLTDGETTRSEGGWTAGGKAAGIAMGGYHFAQPGDPVRQANVLVDRCEYFGTLDLAPCLDLEGSFKPNQAAIDFAISFLRRVKARGHRPCLYANNSMLQTVRGPVKAAMPDTWIWVARYGAKPTVTYDLWQHSQTGSVPGIRASGVDLDTGTVPYNRSGSTMAATVAPQQKAGFLMALSDAQQNTLYNQVMRLVPGDGTPKEGNLAHPAGDAYIADLGFRKSVASQLAGLQTAFNTVTDALGTQQGVDPAAIKTAVLEAMKDAVVNVDVNVAQGAPDAPAAQAAGA